MTEWMDVVLSRRSIRKYEERPVPDEALGKILEAVRFAPSWTNCQCWDIVVVREEATKRKLQEAVAPKNPALKSVAAAPVVLAVCGRKGVSGYYDGKASTKFGDWYMFDLGIAAQTLCLAAWSLGLGTVVVGLMDHDQAGAVLGVPDTHDLVALIPLGYPAKTPSAPKRREIDEFVHWESF
ncbi:nitroreductase family protein [Desulfococcus sp.]|uniref:nitroreductase family protein n=1 Tax=Desulfococcus sp. TaxID=2025834 RepID=UPI0035936A80